MAWNIAPDMPLFVVSQRSDFEIEVGWIPESVNPVRLSLVAKAHELIAVGLEKHQQGASLAICMEKEAALKLYSEIRSLALTMGWPLPTECDREA